METAMTCGTQQPQGELFCVGAHCDDLAFSLGAALWDGRLAGCRPVTVFSRSGYTFAEPDSDVVKVSAQRKQEDERFFAGTTAGEPVWLEQPDAPLRRDLQNESVFLATMRTDEWEAVANALEAILTPSATLLAPLGLGAHLDHRIVSHAASQLALQRRCDVVFYEDLPYAGFMDLEAIEDAVHALGRRLGTTLRPIYWPSQSLRDAKAHAVACYASQTDAESLHPLRYHAGRLQQRGVPAERVWVPEGVTIAQ